jgi:hypothetical protein
MGPDFQQCTHFGWLVEPVVARLPFLLGFRKLYVKAAEELRYQLVYLAQRNLGRQLTLVTCSRARLTFFPIQILEPLPNCYRLSVLP